MAQISDVYSKRFKLRESVYPKRLKQCRCAADPRWHTTLFQRCFKVDLVLVRDVEQLLFNVETTSGKDPFLMLKQRQISTLKERQLSTLKQRQISTLIKRQISTLKKCQIRTLKQRQISMLIRLNKIKCLFNVEVRRCFNVVSTCICLLGCHHELCLWP